MRYISFQGTYNEQIYDSEARTITWCDGARTENVRVITEDDAGGLLPQWKRVDEHTASN